MKVINASVSFKIENKFSKEDLENHVYDYSDEIEDLLDYDCTVFDPITVEEGEEEIILSFPVEAYMEIIDENNKLVDEDDVKKEVEGGAFTLKTILEDNLEGEIEMRDMDYSTRLFKDTYDYKNWILGNSIINLSKNDNDFEESFPFLLFDSYDAEITAMHQTENGIYVQGLDEDGEHFNLALKYTKERNDEDLLLLQKHMEDLYPEGHQYYLEIIEEGEGDDDWSIINYSEDDMLHSYFKALSLKDVDPDNDKFYAVDSLLCCIDDEYESQIDEDFYDDCLDDDDE